MYIDTMQNVLSKTGKIFIDSNSSNSLFVLPIEKMLRSGVMNANNVEPAQNQQSTSSTNEDNNFQNRNSRGRRQKAIKLRLGKIEASDYEPGLHFKMPLINNVKIFDDRIQMLDERADKYLTKEKKNVLVDSFVKWKINDVSKFFVTMQGDYSRANVRISQIVRDGLRSAFDKRTEKEAISGERSEIMQTITVHTIEQVKDFGIEVVDLRIKRVDLPPEISRSVFQRMDSERDRAAKELRSKGAEQLKYMLMLTVKILNFTVFIEA